jgi:hypothetical protein
MHRAYYIQEQNVLFCQSKVIVVGFMWGLGQHTLLGIVVWFTWVSGNAHYWVLLLVYVGPWATHFTGSDVGIQQWV